MHDFNLREEIIARAVAREGRAHSVVDLHGPSTALVVVDMQRYFMEEPYAGACPVAREIVPNVNTLAKGVRQAGGLVVWLQMEAEPLESPEWTSLRGRYHDDAAVARWRSLQPGSRGHELWPELAAEPGDLTIPKRRYSAFIPGSSDLDEQLRHRGIDTLLIAGVATNACCESTARDAMMMNYRVLMVSDACAAATDEEHAAALDNFYLFFGDVQHTAEVLRLL